MRLRLTLPFAAAMSIGLAAMGLFIYLRVGGTMLSSVDQNLAAQVDEATHNVAEERPQPHRPGRQQRADDRAARARRRLGGRVGAAAAAAAGPTAPVAATTHDVAVDRGAARHVAASRSRRSGSTARAATLVVGRSLAARAETLDRLGHEFLLAAPAALLLALVAGYGLAAAALRPVEAMRRRAAAVTAATPGRRLPVPPARDEISALAVTLNDMLARLEASFEHERRFVADASHELRTPLALLKAELELALRRPRIARGARERARVGGRGDRAAHAARRGSAADRARRPGPAADPARASPRRRGPRPGPRALRRPRRVARTRRSSSTSSEDPELVADPAAARAGDRQPRRQRAAARRRRRHARRTRTRTAASSCTSPTRAPGSHRTSSARAFDRFSRPDDGRSSGGIGLGLVDRRADRRRPRRRGARREPRRRRHRGLALAAGGRSARQAAALRSCCSLLLSATHTCSLPSHAESPRWVGMTGDEQSIGRAAAVRDAAGARIRKTTAAVVALAAGLTAVFTARRRLVDPPAPARRRAAPQAAPHAAARAARPTPSLVPVARPATDAAPAPRRPRSPRRRRRLRPLRRCRRRRSSPRAGREPASASFPALGTTAVVVVADAAALAARAPPARARARADRPRVQPVSARQRARDRQRRRRTRGRRLEAVRRGAAGRARRRPRHRRARRSDARRAASRRRATTGRSPSFARATAGSSSRSRHSTDAWREVELDVDARPACACRTESSSTSARPPRRWPPTVPRRRSPRRPAAARSSRWAATWRWPASRPPGGWCVRIADDHRTSPDSPGPRVADHERRPGDVEHDRPRAGRPTAGRRITCSTRPPACRPTLPGGRSAWPRARASRRTSRAPPRSSSATTPPTGSHGAACRPGSPATTARSRTSRGWPADTEAEAA